ncbi:MAG: PaaI family thioesterase, partial [Methanoregulaceae archaeon]|nr:PaaI family thioesterase [Methanoregulaceae archaeon]
MDYITRIRRNGRNANPFFVAMGIEVVSFENGRAVLRMPVRPDMMNGEQYLQGGLYTALADEAIVLALYSGLAEGETVATISESTSFLAGVRTGIVIAEGRIVRKGRRVAFG